MQNEQQPKKKQGRPPKPKGEKQTVITAVSIYAEERYKNDAAIAALFASSHYRDMCSELNAYTKAFLKHYYETNQQDHETNY